MREFLIKKAGTSVTAAVAMILLLIFIAAMKSPQSSNTYTYTYLALGDSYTIGEKVEPGDNFPHQVVALLREQGRDVENPVIVAKTGWTTDELQAGIKKAKLGRHYDFVSLLIGVNDQYRGRPVTDYIPRFESLLNWAIKFAGNDPSHVIVLSIPDWGATPFAEGRDRDAIAREIDSYNAANKKIATEKKVLYIDITPGTRESATQPGMLAEDGLHPSGKEYRKWAMEVVGLVQSLK